jgi:hypothetical protein
MDGVRDTVSGARDASGAREGPFSGLAVVWDENEPVVAPKNEGESWSGETKAAAASCIGHGRAWRGVDGGVDPAENGLAHTLSRVTSELWAPNVDFALGFNNNNNNNNNNNAVTSSLYAQGAVPDALLGLSGLSLDDAFVDEQKKVCGWVCE